MSQVLIERLNALGRHIGLVQSLVERNSRLTDDEKAMVKTLSEWRAETFAVADALHNSSESQS